MSSSIIRSASPAKLVAAVLVAAALWFMMFSPWTSGLLNFWMEMSISAVILTSLGICFSGTGLGLGETVCGSRSRIDHPAVQALLGVVIAFALWGIFWVGDRLSSLMFDFARPQVDNVYAMKTGLPAWAIATLLLLVIGPAEEFFWRGFVQKNLTRIVRERTGERRNLRIPDFIAFALTTAVYALIHIWSFNFMLVMAALVAGCIWGFIYMLRPRLLPALIISHALWDALVFVILPI